MRQAERATKCGLLLQRQAQLNNRRADSSIFMNLGRRSSNRRYTRATKWIPHHEIIEDSQQPVLNSPYPPLPSVITFLVRSDGGVWHVAGNPTEGVRLLREN